MDTSELTATAQKNLVTSLQHFGNVLSIPHRKTLYCLLEAFMQMAEGKLQGRVAFGIPTGCGKTRAIIEAAAAIHHADAPYSLVVCASRIEALCTMKRDMVKCGIPADKIGLMYSQPKKGAYSLPRTDDNQNRQFLLVSHQRLREREQDIDQYNTFREKQRDILVYDESLLVSDIEHFLVEPLMFSLGGWINKFKLDIDQHAPMLSWLTEWNAILDFAYHHYDAEALNHLKEPQTELTGEQFATYAALLRTAGDTLLANFLQIGGLPMRMIRHNRTAAISYRIVIPEALKNILVLDASYPIRKLEQSDPTLKNAEDLPSCKAFSLRFNELKRFDRVTLYRMASHGGRSSVATDKTKMRKLLQDVSAIIKDIPEDEGVLVFVYKDRNKRDMKKALDLELRKVGIELEDKPTLPTGQPRISIETWGCETSLNEYRYCKHVVLVGILHRDMTELEAQQLGQLNDLHRKVDAGDLKAIALSERSHLAYQALSRGACRVMDEPGQAGAMTGYVVEYEEGIENELSKVMPGVSWRRWTPLYSDAVAHGKRVMTRVDQILTHLQSQSPTTEALPCRRVRAALKVPKGDSTTWKRASRKAIEQLPQWIQEYQRFKRVV